jgi:hypothetical protein
MPIKANTSFRVEGAGVRPEPLSAWRLELTDGECDRIDELAAETHRELMAAAARS